MALPVNFKDDVLASSMDGKRRYNMITNSDGTVSFEDVTTYSQEGSNFGSAQINNTNGEINKINNNVLDTIEEISANTSGGKFAGALALKNVNNSIQKLQNISTEEHIIGSFMGKTLYSKTITASKTNAENQIVNHGIKNVDIIWLDISNTFLSTTSDNSTHPYFNTGINSADRSFQNAYLSLIQNINSTNINIRNGTAASTGKWYITLKYTKTTDN